MAEKETGPVPFITLADEVGVLRLERKGVHHFPGTKLWDERTVSLA